MPVKITGINVVGGIQGTTIPMFFPPTVTDVTPDTASSVYGRSITITGTWFENVTSVTVGGRPVSSFTVVNDTTITATTNPNGITGDAAVVVTTDYGTSNQDVVLTYYAPPAVTALSPSSGSTAGGNSVLISGSGFTANTVFRFDGSTFIEDVTIISDVSASVVMPARTAGTYKVIGVNNEYGTGTVGVDYTYVSAPSVASITPTYGGTSGGTVITISGSNFVEVTGVTVGGVAVTGYTVNSANSITATVPAGVSGTAAVVVSTDYGTSNSNVLFTYISAPTVTSVLPSIGPSTGGTSVTITGTGFYDVSGVTFAGVAATSYTVNSPTSITAVTPAGTEGTASVNVTTAYGTNANNTLYTYGTAADPYWGNVVLLIQGDYADGTTTIVDSSSFAKPTTIVGTVTNSTAVTPPFGTSSVRSLGTASVRNYLQYADSEDWYFANGNFTVEMWFRVATFNGSQNVFWAQLDSQGFAPIRLEVSSSEIRARLRDDWSGGVINTGTVSTNTWYHVALVRNGTSMNLYRNGVSGTTYNIGTSNLQNSAEPLQIAGIRSNSNSVPTFNGYMKGVRVTKGVARYTSNFTVPTGPFPTY